MTNLATLKFYITPPHDCGYLEDRQASSLFLDPAVAFDGKLYAHLSAHGFRRSGDYLYRPHCEQCSACEALRIRVADFRTNRSQRRCWKKNADLTVVDTPVRMSEAHYELYQRYLEARHREGDMYPPSREQYESFLVCGWKDSRFLEFYLAERLLAVAVIDLLPDSLSAVYTFYDPDEEVRGLGNYAVLYQIELAKQRSLEYLYLGYWIRGCRKMAYKNRFRPAELLQGNRWVRIPYGKPFNPEA